MNRQKIIPIFIACGLMVVAIILYSGNVRKNKHYTELKISFNNEDKTIKDKTTILKKAYVMGKNC